MRHKWYKKEKLKIGDTRVISKFLFWPKTIGGETRWMENVSIEQETYYYSHTTKGANRFRPFHNDPSTNYKWQDNCWLDEPKGIKSCD